MVSAPPCDFAFGKLTCRETTPHLCEPRVQKVVSFFSDVLRHPVGRYAGQPFELAEWQREHIVRPLFGRAVWNDQWETWTRQYDQAWIEVGRGSGKTTLIAGLTLFLLTADGEEGAEIYGAAGDTDQAGLVYRPARLMVERSPYLSKRLTVRQHAKRILDERTASFYQVIAADGSGALGQAPHGVLLDEVITQRNRELFDALRTGLGKRTSPLMICITTAGNDVSSWVHAESQECERIQEDPARQPNRFVYIRRVPETLDPFDPSAWQHANPALGTFLSTKTLQDEANAAKNDPSKLNSFLQFRCNRWVQQVTRWIPMHLWEAAPGGRPAPDPIALRGQRCFGGLDLSATTDFTSFTLLFPDADNACLFRLWLPEAQLRPLDEMTGGKGSVWVRDNLITLCPGDVIDTEQVVAQVVADAQTYRLVDVSYDRYLSQLVAQQLEKQKVTALPVAQGFNLSAALKELYGYIKSARLRHGDNPVVAWMADAAEIRQNHDEQIALVKPDRGKAKKRVDAIASLAMATDGVMRRGQAPPPRRYETAGF